jgi:hypothetical protein
MHGRDASLRVALSFKTDEADTVGSGEPNRSARVVGPEPLQTFGQAVSLPVPRCSRPAGT